MKRTILLRSVVICVMLSATSILNAKELTLKLRSNSSYPMKIHYKFSSAQNYAEGNIDFIKNNEIQYIYVNRVPDEEDILIQVDKMTVANRTEFNDPCELKLDKTELNATIIVGFKGNPENHGSFTCNVSKD